MARRRRLDRVAPNPPVLSADRAPAGSDWYRDGVQVRFADGGDPALPGRERRSGLNPGVGAGSAAVTATGTTTISGSVGDRAGNTSPPVSRTYRVDAVAPMATRP